MVNAVLAPKAEHQFKLPAAEAPHQNTPAPQDTAQEPPRLLPGNIQAPQDTPMMTMIL